jgi:hypothetical protein
VDQEWLKKQLQNDQPCCSAEDVRQRDRTRKGRKADPPERSNKKIWEDPSTDVRKNLELPFYVMQDVLTAVEGKTLEKRKNKTFFGIEKIISGGQTGADRAALDAALELGIPCGGWCPKGRRAEDGPIDVRYPLKETHSASYRIRTEKNVRGSDGTLIFAWGKPKGGTALTIRFAQRYKKPYLVVDLSEGADPETAQEWLESNEIKILNIAGLREGECPGIYIRTVDFLKEVFNEPKRIRLGTEKIIL